MNEPIHPCVEPRRRFIRRVLAICLLLQITGGVVAAIRYGILSKGTEITLITLLEWLILSPFPYILPLIPGRCKQISLLQLICLIAPVFCAIAAVWLSLIPIDDEEIVWMSGLFYITGMAVIILLFFAFQLLFLILGIISHKLYTIYDK